MSWNVPLNIQTSVKFRHFAGLYFKFFSINHSQTLHFYCFQGVFPAELTSFRWSQSKVEKKNTWESLFLQKFNWNLKFAKTDGEIQTSVLVVFSLFSVHELLVRLRKNMVYNLKFLNSSQKTKKMATGIWFYKQLIVKFQKWNDYIFQ